MAQVIENLSGRRQIRLSTDDIIHLVREYQNITAGSSSYEQIRSVLDDCLFYLPESV